MTTQNELRQQQLDDEAKKLKALQKRYGVHPTLSNKPDAVAARDAKEAAEAQADVDKEAKSKVHTSSYNKGK